MPPAAPTASASAAQQVHSIFPAANPQPACTSPELCQDRGLQTSCTAASPVCSLVSAPPDPQQRGCHCPPQMEALRRVGPTCLQVTRMLRSAVTML
jgi:hypothetical protein